MSSAAPLSSAPLSSLVSEVEGAPEDIFGGGPSGGAAAIPTFTGSEDCCLKRAITRLRDKILPDVIGCMVSTPITLVRRTEVVNGADPLSRRWVDVTQEVDAVVSGPSVENIRSGLLAASDFEVLIPVKTQGTPLFENDAIRIDGRQFDIIQVQGHPRIPLPIAYKYMVKRAG